MAPEQSFWAELGESIGATPTMMDQMLGVSEGAQNIGGGVSDFLGGLFGPGPSGGGAGQDPGGRSTTPAPGVPTVTRPGGRDVETGENPVTGPQIEPPPSPGELAQDILGGPPGGSGADPYAGIAQAQRQAARQARGLDEAYQESLDQLRSMYKFAPTAAEKAQIQFMLDNLQAQREAGQQVIEQSYDQAVRSSQRRAQQMQEQAAQVGEATGDIYREAAQDTADLLSGFGEASSDSGLGLGAGVGGEAQDWVGVLSQAAPREQAAAQQTFGLGAQDVAAMGQSLEGEQSAQQAELQRLAAQLAAQQQMQWNQQVMNRIGQERRAFAGQAGNLQSQFRNRGWALQDSSRQASRDAAAFARQQAAADAQAQRQYQQDVRDMATQIRLRRNPQFAQAAGLGGEGGNQVDEETFAQVMQMYPEEVRQNPQTLADALNIAGALDSAGVADLLGESGAISDPRSYGR